MDGTKSVAVKILKGVDEWRLQQFRREIELLRSLSHSSHVVQVSSCDWFPLPPLPSHNEPRLPDRTAKAAKTPSHKGGQLDRTAKPAGTLAQVNKLD